LGKFDKILLKGFYVTKKDDTELNFNDVDDKRKSMLHTICKQAITLKTTQVDKKSPNKNLFDIP